MTPQEILQECESLKRQIGDHAHVSVTIRTAWGYAGKDGAVRATVYSNWPSGSPLFSLESSDWRELLDTLNAKWVEFRDEHRKRQTRKMALAIIRITAEQGACSDAALRADDFTGSDIKSLGSDACADADAIASNGPFSIATIKGANAA